MRRWAVGLVLAGVLAAADGSTPLHRAAYADDLAAVERLLRGGADVKEANRYGVTALSLACTNGNGAMVARLLEAGADANTALPGGETALMTAARTGSVEAVRALLSKGADVKARESKQGQTALHWAAAEGHAAVIAELVKAGAVVEDRLDSGYTPLLFAVREGRIAAVKALLKAGAEVNDTTPVGGRRTAPAKSPRQGTSALILATLNAHYELGRVLLEAGANPNADGPGYTALHAVTWVRKPGLGDNDPAPQGSGELTSLEFVKALVAKGADINARMGKKIGVGMTGLNTAGGTAFFLAARTADAELMRLLAQLGADTKLGNADGSTPLMAAAGLGTRSPGEDAGTEAEVMEAIEVAIELGNDVNAVDQNGETAMHGAAYKNLPGAVRLLAKRGAKREVWDRKNRFGWTPMRIAEGYRFGNYKPSDVTMAAFRELQ
ncbi:MAG: ankyrin repeat domain-containing protein [Acidobacteria bacterium]|nr:ankyrin repeat domain-containing protein [Bryobacteraceae bacterium CoA2 C42]